MDFKFYADRNHSMKMSLKWKFIIAFTVIPLVSLSVFFFLIYKTIKSDRLASIYETALTQSRLQSKLTAEKISPITSFMEYWAEFYFRDPVYSTTIIRIMREHTQPLKGISSSALIEYNPIEMKVTHSQLQKWSDETIRTEVFLKHLEAYRGRLEQLKKPLVIEGLHSKDWVLVRQFKKTKEKEIFVLSAINPQWTQSGFAGQLVTKSFWFNDEGSLISHRGAIDDDLSKQILRTIASGKSTLGAFQIKYKGIEYIAAYNIPKQAQIIMVNLIKADLAREALQATFQQSLLLLAIILLVAMVIGILLSNKLTMALALLVRATRTLGRGKFNIQLNIKSGDEIEDLGKSVIEMSQKIQNLINETKDLGRMESELLLGREVQSTLFPPEAFDAAELSIRGFSKPASEVGGDWWGYYDSPTDYFIFVGDATGHGVPAALLTTAIHSIVGTLLNLQINRPQNMLQQMNRALFQTSQGKKTMTLALLKINKSSGQLDYAIAGHEAPILMRKLSIETKLKDLISFECKEAVPLGLSLDSIYEEQHLQLEPSDTILIYSDGATDARDQGQKSWGERRFTKTVTEALVHSYDMDGAMNEVRRAFDRHTQGAPLIDDVTIVLVKYHGAA